MKAVQEVVYRDIEVKMRELGNGFAGGADPTAKLRNEVIMSNSQYKKILELMLDLEKKMDKRFLESHHETANAISNALDITLLKKDIEDQLNNLSFDIESKFETLFNDRIGGVETQMDN